MGNKTQLNLKTVLHEPITPYSTNAYNTLISVIQGIALAALFYIINESIVKLKPASFDISFVCRIVLAFLLICLIWHRYIVHDQYIAWRLTVFDTIIPMVFALLQIFLILSIPKSPFLFPLCLASLFFWGMIAYINAEHRLGKAESRELYKEHYKCLGDEFAEKLIDEIKAFQKNSQIVMLISTILLVFLAVAIRSKSYSDETCTILITTVSLPCIVLLFFFDLRHRLNKAKTLDKYKISF